MRAVVFSDGQVQVAQVDTPKPGYGQILVEVRAAGLNGADIAQMQGRYNPPPGASSVAGLEMAGEVVATGEGCRRFAVGDQVMAVVQGGGQAEYCLVDEPLAMALPQVWAKKATQDELWACAGGFSEVFATAHDALFTQAGLAMGERVCIHGAAGGVGTAAVQLGVAAGAEVTATVRNPANRRAVGDLGAKAIAPEEFLDAGPYEVILELVGAPNWPANLRALITGGRIMIIGVGAGAEVPVNLALLMVKRARLLGSTLRPRSLEQRALVARALERHVLALVSKGKVAVPVARTFALSDAAEAYEYFVAPGKLGKVVLIP
ncbi:MAG: zinc-binding dehydrogenase [bacterium]|nr:zinc-binding dehydrogenase [bacterium]